MLASLGLGKLRVKALKETWQLVGANIAHMYVLHML